MLTFPSERPLFLGVVHLAATPGSPRFRGSVAELVEAAVRDARVLFDEGCDGLVVENFGDVPFFRDAVPSETVAAMALALQAVLGLSAGRPVGVNVLRNDVRSALGLCAASGAEFVRVNVHTSAAVTDQGIIEGRAAETLRERARLCPAVQILADVHVKHASPLSRETIGEAAADTVQRGLADVVIVSGAATGQAPSADLVRDVRAAVGRTPVLLGSGVDARNAKELLAHADGAIVGTALKRQGRVENEVDAQRVAGLRRIFDTLARQAR
jgi:uncharacterized protein